MLADRDDLCLSTTECELNMLLFPSEDFRMIPASVMFLLESGSQMFHAVRSLIWLLSQRTKDAI